MAGGEPGEAGGSHVVVGVDGSGRTRRLGRLAAAQEGPVVRLQATASGAELADLLAGSPPSVPASGPASVAGSAAPSWPGAVPGGRVLVVDDAHRLSPDAAQVLLAAVRGGDRLLLARRSTLSPGLAELEAAADAAVELLAPLDRAAVASLLSAATGHAAPAELAAAVLTASAGWPALAVPLARAAAEPRQAAVDGPPPAVLARVQRALALAGPDAAAVALVLALDPELPDAELARAVDWPDSPAAGTPDAPDAGRVPAAVRSLRDAGLLTPGAERLVPVVAAAVRREQTAVERRAGQRRIVEAWRASGGGPLPLARACRAAGLADTTALDAYLAAAEALRDADPAAAEQWLDRLGGDQATDRDRSLRVAALRAELDLLLGRDRLPDPTAAGIVGDRTLSASPFSHDPGTVGAAAESAGGRLVLAAAVADVRQGNPARGGAALARCGAPGAVLAVPALLAAGRLDLARAALAGAVDITVDAAAERPPVAASRVAQAVLDAVEHGPEAALPALLDALETADLTARGGAAPLWPETPHALTALVAIAAGDLPVAEHALAERVPAERVPAGPSPAAGPGPGAMRRHRMLLAWARLRAGRYDTAVELLRDPDARAGDDGEPVRDRQLRLVLEAGLARRRGDVAAMRALWPRVEPLLARRSVDLLALEPLEELVVVAARLCRPERADPLLDDVDTLVDTLVTGLEAPNGSADGEQGATDGGGSDAGAGLGAWRATAGWLRLQVAVALDDADRAAAAAAAIGSPRSGRAAVLADAARCWAAVLADTVAADEVLAAVDGLAGPAAMPWEASQLAGQAAIRSTDPRLARRLLERARELSHAESAAPPDPSDGRVGALSEREVEVSRLVLAGRTHKEIGSQLYISAKTVEHHVARIRTKLGVQTRAEFVAALRALLADGAAEEIGAARIPPPSPDS